MSFFVTVVVHEPRITCFGSAAVDVAGGRVAGGVAGAHAAKVNEIMIKLTSNKQKFLFFM
jgi:hypothetical protein